MSSPTLKRACVRSLEIIGEATQQLLPALSAKYRNTEWTTVASMGDKLTHHYFGVDYEVIWDAMVNDVPETSKVVEQMLADLEKIEPD